MSTKIYTGYRFPTKDPLGNFKRVTAAIPLIQQHTQKIMLSGMRTWMRRNTLIARLRGATSEAASIHALQGISDGIHYQIQEKANPDQSHVFTDIFAGIASLAYYPSRDGDRYDLTTLYGGNEMEKAMVKILGLISHGYWDNCDPPDDTSDEEWDLRKKDWDWLETPISSGWSFQAFTTDQFHDLCLETLELLAKRPEKRLSPKNARSLAEKVSGNFLQEETYQTILLAKQAAGANPEPFQFSSYDRCRPDYEEMIEFVSRPEHAWLTEPIGVQDLPLPKPPQPQLKNDR